MLVREAQQAERDRRETDLSSEGFAALLLLRRHVAADAEPVARELATAFAAFPHWRQSREGERELRKALYRALVEHDFPVDDMSTVAEQLLLTLRKAAG